VLTHILFPCHASLNAQESPELHYRFKVGIALEECNASGKKNGNVDTPPDGSSFTIAGTVDADTYIIRFWRWNTTGSSAANDKTANKLTENDRKALERRSLYERFNVLPGTPITTIRYFLLPKASLAMFAQVLAPKYTPLLGAAVLPFKLRPQRGDFTDDLTLTGMAGWNLSFKRNKEHGIALVVGLGLAKVEVDSATTRGEFDEVTQLSAISPSLGLVYHWHRMQIGVFSGADWVARAQGKVWIYQGKPWLAFGIGAAIFNSESAVDKEKSQSTVSSPAE